MVTKQNLIKVYITYSYKYDESTYGLYMDGLKGSRINVKCLENLNKL